MRMDGGENCDHHLYFDSLGHALHESWNNADPILAPLIYGIQPLAERVMPDDVQFHRKRLNERVLTTNADILHDASIAGNIYDLIDAVNESDMKVVLVGPQHLNVLPIDCERLNIRTLNCWLDYDWLSSTLDNYRNHIILYSASMVTNVLIHEMYSKYGNSIIQIDCGSVWEPYVGRQNRKYHAQILNRV
jgi:hypothetical protein